MNAPQFEHGNLGGVDNVVIPNLAEDIRQTTQALYLSSQGLRIKARTTEERERKLASTIQSGLGAEEELRAIAAQREEGRGPEKETPAFVGLYLGIMALVARGRHAEADLMAPHIGLSMRLAAGASAKAVNAETGSALPDGAKVEPPLDIRKQVAVVALLRAARAFQPEGEPPVRFADFAAPIIKRELDRYAAKDLDPKEEQTGISPNEDYVISLLRAVREFIPGTDTFYFGPFVTRILQSELARNEDSQHQGDISLDVYVPAAPEEESAWLLLGDVIPDTHTVPSQQAANSLELVRLVGEALQTLPPDQADAVCQLYGLYDGTSRTFSHISAQEEWKGKSVSEALNQAYKALSTKLRNSSGIASSDNVV